MKRNKRQPRTAPPPPPFQNQKSKIKNLPSTRRGVVLVVTMLAVLLLAGLVLWVLNLGQQVNRRVTAQHGADAAARAGAGWVARSLNTVAANNTDMARTIALINVLDPQPQVNEFTLRETRAFRDKLGRQLTAGINGSPQQLYDFIDDQLRDMLGEMGGEIATLAETQRLLPRPDVREMTDFQQEGRLWDALYGMSELNEAIMENLGETAQAAANSGGRANMPADETAASLMLPLEADVPHQRGIFGDFEWPVRQGMLSPFFDDRTISRGPWDVLYGWRDKLGYYENRFGRRRSAGAAMGRDIFLSRGAEDEGPVDNRRFVEVAYRTYGPQEWMLRRIDCHAARDLPHTRLGWYQRRLTEAVTDYIFPHPLDPRYTNTRGLSIVRQGVCTPSGAISNRGFTEYVVDPDWRLDYIGATRLADGGELAIKETAFFVIEIKSRYPRGHPEFMTPGSYGLVGNRRHHGPRIVIARGWVDPRVWERYGIERVADYVWLDEWQYGTNFDPSIGIPFQGTLQPVYRIDHFVFAGINVGDEAVVHDPYAGFAAGGRRQEWMEPPEPSYGGGGVLPPIIISPGGSSSGGDPGPPPRRPPAPMLLGNESDMERVAYDDSDARREFLTYLSIVRRSDRPRAWASRFRGGRPHPSMVAVAQAKVFNNHSWDLWTRMWRAQLEPVSDYGQWAERLGEDELPPGVSPAEVARLRRYMHDSRDLAEVMMGH